MLAGWVAALSLFGCAAPPPPPDPGVLAERDWPTVDKAGTEQALTAFAQRYPDTVRGTEALKRIRALAQHAAYLQALQVETAAAMEAFLVAHPAAEDATAAYDALQLYFLRAQDDHMEREWQQASASNDVAVLAAFTQRNPKSPRLATAREQMQRLAPDAGFAGHVRSLLALEREELRKKKAGDQTPAAANFGYYPVMSAGEPLAIIFKNQEQRYTRISSPYQVRTLLDAAVEYTQLRGIAPYDAFILLIDEASAAKPKELWDKFGSLFFIFLDMRCKALFNRSCGSEIYRFAVLGYQAYPRDLPGTKVAEISVEIARRNPGYGAMTEAAAAASPPRFEDTPFVLAHVQRLRDLALSGDDPQRRLAVLGLLHVPDSASAQALSEVAGIRPTELVQTLVHPFKPIQARAEQVVVRAGPTVVPELVAALGAQPMRLRAIQVLQKIKDPRSVDPLAKLLRSRAAGPAVAAALKSMNWQPTSDTERVDHLIATRDRAELTKQWPMASAVLFRSVYASKTIDYDSLNALISIGHPDAVVPLRLLLQARGSQDLATFFMNCGNRELSAAAEAWAEARKYWVIRIPAASGGARAGAGSDARTSDGSAARASTRAQQLPALQCRHQLGLDRFMAGLQFARPCGFVGVQRRMGQGVEQRRLLGFQLCYQVRQGLQLTLFLVAELGLGGRRLGC